MVRGTLCETRLSEDQVIESLSDRMYRVRTIVADSKMLRGWILSYGARVVVEGPADLRDEVAATVKEMADRYSEDPLAL